MHFTDRYPQHISLLKLCVCIPSFTKSDFVTEIINYGFVHNLAKLFLLELCTFTCLLVSPTWLLPLDGTWAVLYHDDDTLYSIFNAAKPDVLAKIKIWSPPKSDCPIHDRQLEGTFTCWVSHNIKAKSCGNCPATSNHMKGNHYPCHVCPHGTMWVSLDRHLWNLYLGFLLKLDKITDTLHEGLHQFVTDPYNRDGVCYLWGTNQA